VLRQAEGTPLRDHVALVKRLARSAYSDLPEAHRRNFTLIDFMQSLRDVGLCHQLQAKGVTTLESALQIGEDYLRAEQLHTGKSEGMQVTAEIAQPLGEKMGQLSARLKRMAKTLTDAGPPNRGQKGETAGKTTRNKSNNKPGPPRSRDPQPRKRPHEQKREQPQLWQIPRRTTRPIG